MLESISYRAVRSFFLRGERGILAVDCGWPASLADYGRELRRLDFGLSDIGLLCLTHFHLDHAGLAGELQARGIPLFVFPKQMPHLEEMEGIIGTKHPGYRRIDRSRLLLGDEAAFSARLASLGIAGVALPIEWHSPDGICYRFRDDMIIGDLQFPDQIMAEDELGRRTWAGLLASGAARFHHSHAGTRGLEELRASFALAFAGA